MTLTVLLSSGEKRIDVRRGESALDALKRGGVAFSAPCGGLGVCGGCRAKMTGAMTSSDGGILSDGEKSRGVRLLCRTFPAGDCTVDLRGTDLEVQTEGVSADYPLSPLAPGKFGAAIDIGTTTVAVYLCDMESGRIVASSSAANPQSVYGADVISRIDAIKRDFSALEAQRSLIISLINNKLSLLCGGEICAAVICGNTVMEHIAAGEDPRGIATYPFTPKTLFGSVIPAEKVGLAIKRGAPVLFAPCISSYVGGDISCGAAVTALADSDVDTLYLDVGTNGEIGFAHKGKLYFCSAAAGPALEGAGIKRGMPCEAGAVCEVGIQDNILMYKTIKNAAAKGICGSGVIDAVAVMLSLSVVDETGRTDVAGRFMKKIGGEDVFTVSEKDDIYITPSDVRAVQLAKAAIAAGERIIAGKCGGDINKVGKVILAGGFGSHIRPESAERIGLIPVGTAKKTVAVGNVAGTGAVALLLSEEMRQRARAICRDSVYTELSSCEEFSDAYIDAMMF